MSDHALRPMGSRRAMLVPRECGAKRSIDSRWTKSLRSVTPTSSPPKSSHRTQQRRTCYNKSFAGIFGKYFDEPGTNGVDGRWRIDFFRPQCRTLCGRSVEYRRGKDSDSLYQLICNFFVEWKICRLEVAIYYLSAG